MQELSTYNNAIGVGKWVDVENFDNEVESLLEEATEVLKSENLHFGVDAEEWEIMDYDTDIDINLDSCYQDIRKLQELDELLNNSDSEEIEKIKYLIYLGYDIKDIHQEALENLYVYEDWESVTDEFVDLYLEVSYDSKIYNYIDHAAIQRDLEIDGFTEYGNKIFKDFN